METASSPDSSGISLDAEQARRQLAEAERAEASVWTAAPRTGWPWPPAVGLWFGAMVWLQSIESTLLSIIGVAVLLGILSATIRWSVKKRGTSPASLRSAPAEFRGPMFGYLVAVGVTVVSAVVLYVSVGWLSAALFVTVAATTIIAVYERMYAKAAAAANARLDAAIGHRP